MERKKRTAEYEAMTPAQRQAQKTKDNIDARILATWMSLK